MTTKKIVIGEGWAALATAGFWLEAGHAVTWISGTGSRPSAALPSLDVSDERGAALWSRLAAAWTVETGALTSGSFLREFRNKAFREPLWTKAPTPEARAEVMRETLWASESSLAPRFEARFERTFNEIELEIRTRVLAHPALTRIEGVPVNGFEEEHHHVRAVILASGQKAGGDEIVYADRWTSLIGMAGMPKGISFLRKREPVSVLEATFTHAAPIGAGVAEGFFGPLHREAGEEFERHLWGHFSSDGMSSQWLLCLAGEEVEDNHQIAKKLRRMKNALEKMFVGAPWLSEGVEGFSANVVSESVRFAEASIFSDGEAPAEVPHVAALRGVSFVTDGYGPASAIIQVARALGFDLQAEAQGEGVDVGAEAPASQELGGRA